jgi:hypothetical protein
MKKIWVSIVMACALGACAAPGARSDAQWAAYRAQVTQDENAGTLSPSQAQERLHVGWVNIYGDDPTMRGFFAYSETLLRSAEQGRLSMSEAKELVKEREQSAWREYLAEKKRRDNLIRPDYDL